MNSPKGSDSQNSNETSVYTDDGLSTQIAKIAEFRETTQPIIVNHRTNSDKIGVGLVTRNPKFKLEMKSEIQKPIKFPHQECKMVNSSKSSKKWTAVAETRPAGQRGIAGKNGRFTCFRRDPNMPSSAVASTSAVLRSSVGNGRRSGPLVCVAEGGENSRSDGNDVEMVSHKPNVTSGLIGSKEMGHLGELVGPITEVGLENCEHAI
ncbi:hypothetical protein CASFOL_031554 [Castilleja foliolosa]|uniref:Uncharacterized protein n=1 Tax=Castilleja foliolosa TaxID=1961234 RepID=A0ABD3C6B6_9LAMI